VPANSDPLFMQVRSALSGKGFFTARIEELTCQHRFPHVDDIWIGPLRD
jgi:hypothetical protein